MKTSSDLYALTVPRQEFTGWLLSVAAFSQAGLSEVDFLFKDGVLCLESYWGETSMSYEGSFNGKLRIKPQRLLTLAKKGAKMMPQPIPVKLTVDVVRRLLVVDFVEVHASIEVSPLKTPKAEPAASRSSCVGITIAAGHLVELIRQAYPGRAGKKDVIKFIARGAELVIQSSRSSAQREAFILGSGEWTVPAQVFRKVLDTFMAKEMLTIEVDAGGLKLNSFLMPVLTWRATET